MSLRVRENAFTNSSSSLAGAGSELSVSWTGPDQHLWLSIQHNCEPLLTSTSTAGSVHQLRPTDVQVVGAMGDSLTAGFGVLLDAEEIYVNRTDFRGLSWSIGEYI